MLIDLRTKGLNIYFLCPFIGSFCLIGAFFTSSKSIFGKYSIYQNILFSISQMFAVIPYLIIKKKPKNYLNNISTRTDSEDSNINELSYQNIEEEKNDIKIWQTIILGFIYFLHSFISHLGNDFLENKILFDFMSSNVLFLNMLQKFILETHIYRHHIASLIIFFVFDFAYVIIVLFDDKLNYDIKGIIFILLSNFFFSLEITYEKKLLNENNFSLYIICILVGVFSFCFNLISSLITTIISSKIDIEDKYKYKIYLFNYKNYFKEIDEEVTAELIKIFIFIIFGCIFNILQFLTIKYLSANHVLITYIMLSIYNSILMDIQDIEINRLTLTSTFILYIILFFALFIFLEIIQLNFCGINKDISFKTGLQSDVKRYMLTFNTKEEDIKNNDNSKENKETKETKSIEMNETNISARGSELDSYNDE
jgi:drug/metabolite transporter (DMT)-like permease